MIKIKTGGKGESESFAGGNIQESNVSMNWTRSKCSQKGCIETGVFPDQGIHKQHFCWQHNPRVTLDQNTSPKKTKSDKKK